MTRDPAREAALAALFSWDRGGAYADAAVKDALDAAHLDARDAAFAARLFYRCVEMRIYIDYVIAARSEVRPKKLHPAVRQILRLGVCQLLCMDSVPASAAVNTSVDLARLRGLRSAAGYINALLRRVASEGAPAIEGDAREVLSVRTGHPRWLVDLFCGRFGEAGAAALLEADNSAPPTAIRVNTLRTSPEELEKRLSDRGVKLRLDGELPVCGTLADPGRVDAMPEFLEGLFAVQDKASVAAVLAAGPKPGMEVLDLCAAPGGKSLCAAACMRDRGRIRAFDIHPHKADLIAANAARLGAEIVSPSVRDASVFDPALENSADLVIADVPCSGLGVIRKKPDLRYKDPAAFPEIEKTARKIALCAARCVRPGGVLLYSTCTLRREENEDVREMLLRTCPLDPMPFSVTPQIASDEGQITLLPHLHGTDGFYFATFRKRG